MGRTKLRQTPCVLIGGGGGAEWDVVFPWVLLSGSSSVVPGEQGCLLLLLPPWRRFRQICPYFRGLEALLISYPLPPSRCPAPG